MSKRINNPARVRNAGRSKTYPTHSKLLLALILFTLISLPVTAVYAHGTIISLNPVDGQIELVALYDTGEPMSEAQVLVYAADNPREAWHTGVADNAGIYAFTVDNTIAGQWAISIRTAGHGEILYFNVSNSGEITLEAQDERPAWLTTLLTVVVLVGLGGVAYYFSRPKTKE